jgi:hypothetical protein
LRLNFKYLIILTALFILFSVSLVSCTTYNESDNKTSFFLDENFLHDIALVILGAVLTIVTNYVSERLKLKYKLRKQLSYDILTKKDLVEVEEKIRDKVKIIYNGKIIDNLYYVAVDLENSGNTVIKKQHVRFEFPEGTKIIEPFFEPLPEPEIGLEEEINDPKKPHELKYKIGHLESGQRLGYRFILTSDKPEVTPKLHPYNAEGGVVFVPKSISKSRDEKDDITSFITLCLYFLIIPAIIRDLLGIFASGIVRFVIIIALIPFIKPFAKAIGELLSKSNDFKTVNSNSNIIISHLDTIDTIYGNDSKKDN